MSSISLYVDITSIAVCISALDVEADELAIPLVARAPLGDARLLFTAPLDLTAVFAFGRVIVFVTELDFDAALGRWTGAGIELRVAILNVVITI